MKKVLNCIILITIILIVCSCQSNTYDDIPSESISPTPSFKDLEKEQKKKEQEELLSRLREYASQYNAIYIEDVYPDDAPKKITYSAETQKKAIGTTIFTTGLCFDDIIYSNGSYIGIDNYFLHNKALINIPENLYNKIIENNGYFDGIILKVNDVTYTYNIDDLYGSISADASGDSDDGGYISLDIDGEVTFEENLAVISYYLCDLIDVYIE